MSEMTFTYSNRSGLAITTFVMGILIALVLGWLAIVEPEMSFDFFGYIVDGWKAQAFIWACAAGMAAVGVFGAYIFFSFRKTVRRVVLGATSITAPKTPLSTKFIEVAYDDITSVQATPVYRSWVLVVKFPGGSMRIPELYLNEQGAFAQIEAALMSQFQARR